MNPPLLSARGLGVDFGLPGGRVARAVDGVDLDVASGEIFMLLNLMDEPEKIPVAGKVVWVTPKGAQGNRAAGIGVQFSDQDNTAVSKIENYLAGSLESERATHTM